MELMLCPPASCSECDGDQRRLDWAFGPDCWRIPHLSPSMTLQLHPTPVGDVGALLRRRRPVWVRCFDQSSAEVRPTDQYRPPERNGSEILREIARGTPRFRQIARHQSTDSLLAVGLVPKSFQLWWVIRPLALLFLQIVM